jgi:chorismate synthase
MSTFGKLFKVTTFGESHGLGVGCIIDNVPPLLEIKTSDIQYQLDRRKPNQNSLLSARNEQDKVEIYSGVENNITLGTPLCLIVKNYDIKPNDYKSFSDIPRPGHADFTYLTKYGVKSSSGGGRASARETVARVCAGSVAEKYLKEKFDVEIVSWVSSVGQIKIPDEITQILLNTKTISKKDIDVLGEFKLYKNEERKIILYNVYDKKSFYFLENDDIKEITYESKDSNIIYEDNIYKYIEDINIRCPHSLTGAMMIKEIINVKNDNDSIGGIVSCIIKNCPRSIGEPCFDKFEADLAKAMLSIPATKGFEIGSGFKGTKMR